MATVTVAVERQANRQYPGRDHVRRCGSLRYAHRDAAGREYRAALLRDPWTHSPPPRAVGKSRPVHGSGDLHSPRRATPALTASPSLSHLHVGSGCPGVGRWIADRDRRPGGRLDHSLGTSSDQIPATGQVPTPTVLYQFLFPQDQYAPPGIGLPGVPDDGTVPGSQNAQADDSGNVPTAGDMSPLDIPQVDPWVGGEQQARTQALSTGFAVDPTAAFVPNQIGNYDSTTPTSTTTTPVWTDAQGITHTASVFCQSTLTIVATADDSGDWTYDESLDKTWLVSVTARWLGLNGNRRLWLRVHLIGRSGRIDVHLHCHRRRNGGGLLHEAWSTDSGSGTASTPGRSRPVSSRPSLTRLIMRPGRVASPGAARPPGPAWAGNVRGHRRHGHDERHAYTGCR